MIKGGMVSDGEEREWEVRKSLGKKGVWGERVDRDWEIDWEKIEKKNSRIFFFMNDWILWRWWSLGKKMNKGKIN